MLIIKFKVFIILAFNEILNKTILCLLALIYADFKNELLIFNINLIILFKFINTI